MFALLKPSTYGKGLTLNTKISQFLYIKVPLLALVQEYTKSSRELVGQEDNVILIFFVLSSFFSLITTCSPNCPTHTALLHM